MSKKSLRSIGTLTLAFLLLTTLAFATSGLSAWCIVPALNGSANSEDTGVKETTGSSAYLYILMGLSLLIQMLKLKRR